MNRRQGPNPTRGELAGAARTQVAIWAEAASDRFSWAMQEVAGRQAGRSPSGPPTHLLGQVILAVIALERALESARWIAANRPDSTAMLNDAGSIAGPNLAEELDDVWIIVKARRTRLAHMKQWLDREGGGDVAVTRRGLVIEGIPGAFSLTTGAYWSATLERWASDLGEVPFDDGQPGLVPGRVAEDDLPDWAIYPPK